MTPPEAIPFAFAAVVLLWAAWGTAWAFRGGVSSGLPRIHPPAPGNDERDEEGESSDA